MAKPRDVVREVVDDELARAWTRLGPTAAARLGPFELRADGVSFENPAEPRWVRVGLALVPRGPRSDDAPRSVRYVGFTAFHYRLDRQHVRIVAGPSDAELLAVATRLAAVAPAFRAARALVTVAARLQAWRAAGATVDESAVLVEKSGLPDEWRVTFAGPDDAIEVVVPDGGAAALVPRAAPPSPAPQSR